MYPFRRIVKCRDVRSKDFAFGLWACDRSLKLAVFAGAAVPHWDLSVFLRRPYMSLLWTGTVSGLGSVSPVVSDTAETSMAEGGAIVRVMVQSQKPGSCECINC